MMVKSFSIFTLYDIRGLYPKYINKKIAYALGIAFSIFAYKKFRVKTIAIAKDVRKNSSLLADAFKQGIIAQGSRPIDIGLATTPMFYYLIAKHFKAGVMVTPSHLQKQYAGFKFSGPRAINIGIESGLREIQQLYNKIIKKLNVQHGLKPASKNGYRFLYEKIKNTYKNRLKESINYVGDYHSYFIKRYPKRLFINPTFNPTSNPKKIKIVVDPGNGCGFLDISFLKRYFDVISINEEPNGNFPARGPNPLIKGVLKKLQRFVKSKSADFGVAFDGDADRAIFVDNKGNVIPPDFLGGLLALNMLKKVRSKNKNIIVDIRASRAVFEEIEHAKARPILTRSGREFISHNMDKYNALFGLEVTGHYFFRDFWGRDNALISIFEVAKIIAHRNSPKLSTLLIPFQKYARTGDVSILVRDRDKILNSVKRHFANADKILLIDGVYVFYKDFWFELRKSNTEPVLRLSLEAVNNSILNKAKRDLFDVINGKILYTHF